MRYFCFLNFFLLYGHYNSFLKVILKKLFNFDEVVVEIFFFFWLPKLGDKSIDFKANILSFH